MNAAEIRREIEGATPEQLRARYESLTPKDMDALEAAIRQDPTLADLIASKNPELGEVAQQIARSGAAGGGQQKGGLMRAPGGARQGQGAGPSAEAMGAGREPATPEEQAAYDQFVKNAYRLIYGDETFDRVLDMMRAGKEQPVDTLADVAVSVMRRLVDSAEKAGAQIMEEIKLPAGLEVVEDLANLAEKAGIFSLDEKQIEQAFYAAVDRYRIVEQQRGGTDPQRAQAEFGAIKQAAESGELEQMFGPQDGAELPPEAPPRKKERA